MTKQISPERFNFVLTTITKQGKLFPSQVGCGTLEQPQPNKRKPIGKVQSPHYYIQIKRKNN